MTIQQPWAFLSFYAYLDKTAVGSSMQIHKRGAQNASRGAECSTRRLSKAHPERHAGKRHQYMVCRNVYILHKHCRLGKIIFLIRDREQKLCISLATPYICVLGAFAPHIPQFSHTYIRGITCTRTFPLSVPYSTPLASDKIWIRHRRISSKAQRQVGVLFLKPGGPVKTLALNPEQ